MQLSPNLTLHQATYSQSASRNKLDNTPNKAEIEELKKTALELFEPIKAQFPDVVLTSMFRSEKVNVSIGGSKTSQHRLGQAIDIDRPSLEKNKEMFLWIKDNLVFGQLIWEFGNPEGPDWVHVGRGTKKQILVAYRGKDGTTKYKKY